LRVAAERVGRRPAAALAETVAELEDGPGRLDALGAGGDPLADVRAVFSWSIRALPRPAATLFRLLGLSPSPDIDACEAADLAGVPLPEARRLLAILAEAHLVEAGPHGRYRMHTLLRDYARTARAPLYGCSDQFSLVLPLHV